MRDSTDGNSGMLPSANSVVPRPRLETILRDALEASPLVLLQAPFGYGKTTLVDSLVRERGDAALLRAQPWHRGNFIEDLVLAVREARPDFGRRTLGGATASVEPQSLARLFLADLRHVPAQLLLAIDNSEHLSDDSSFTSFIDAVVNDAPHHVHVLLSGRALPHLGAQTLVRTRAVTIPPDALLFSEEELSAALESAGVAADEATVERISQGTKGWPASISLALRAGDDLGLQYVSEALLSALDDGTRVFLERISVFERIEPRILANEAAYGNVGELATRLEGAGVPLVRDVSGYTLHPLVRAFALKELERHGTLSEAHVTAARAFAKHGNLGAALFHLRESGDENAADSLMREFGASIVRTGNHQAIRSVLDLLRSPHTADVRAYITALLSKTTGSAETDRLLERAAASDDDRVAFAARAEQIERRIARSGSADASALADLERRAGELDVDARARAAIFRAWSSAISCDFRAALETLEPFRGASDSSTRFNMGVLSAYARASLGEADAAPEELDSLVRLFENDDRVIFQALTLVWQARVALLLGRTAVAGDAARAALRLMENLTIGAEEAALYFALTEVATHEGNVQQTVAFAERLTAAAPHAWYSGDTVRARAFAETALARAAFLGHDIATARDLAIRSAEAADFPLVQRATAYAEAAMYADLAGDDRARILAERASALAKDARPWDSADAVALANAIGLLVFLGSVKRWTVPTFPLPLLDPFRRLLDARGGLVTTEHAAIALRNLRAGTATAEPFNAALVQMARGGQRFEVRLLRAFAPREPATGPASKPESFDLTPREMEILTFLVDGLSNKEIAQRLVLSPRTVETHVERVLGKLEVGSRSRAIAKALRLGLVDLALL